MKAYCNERLVVNDVKTADTFKSRLKGLLGRDKLADEGLLLRECSSIHCFFMKITIDAVYLSEDMTVLYKETIKPWSLGKIVKNTKHILELPENASKNIKIGDIVTLSD
jgi:uncharacterized membrane protein (UPF0127 family)